MIINLGRIGPPSEKLVTNQAASKLFMAGGSWKSNTKLIDWPVSWNQKSTTFDKFSTSTMWKTIRLWIWGSDIFVKLRAKSTKNVFKFCDLFWFCSFRKKTLCIPRQSCSVLFNQDFFRAISWALGMSQNHDQSTCKNKYRKHSVPGTPHGNRAGCWAGFENLPCLCHFHKIRCNWSPNECFNC